MKTKYEVIWIDDEWEKMNAFKEECEVIHNINLHPFRTQKAGMEALDSNINRWDAVLLDAKMFDQSEENEVAKLDGLRKAIKHINQLPVRHQVPYFISTGQPDLMDNEAFEQLCGKYYIKEKDDLQLIKDIKETIDNSTRFQIKSFYPEAIECLGALNENAKESIVDILETMHYPETHPDFNPVLYYNQLRQILEWNFRYANKFGLIPDACIEIKGVNLNQCCCYLSGKNCDIIHLRYGDYRSKIDFDRIVPQYIENLMFLVLNLGNVNSHTTELDKKEINKLNDFFKTSVNNSRYLIFSLALQVCEISLWLRKYIESHQDVEANKKWCKSVPNGLDSANNLLQDNNDNENIGIVECSNGLYHIGDKFLLNAKTIEQRGWLHKKVKVVGKDINTSSTCMQYPYFAYNIQPIE